jgi:hypothetical protein
VRTAAPICLSIGTSDEIALKSLTSHHPIRLPRRPELQWLIDVMKRRISREIGNPTSSPRALHGVSSQHISTLHNNTGTYHSWCVNRLRSSILLSRRSFCTLCNDVLAYVKAGNQHRFRVVATVISAISSVLTARCPSETRMRRRDHSK